MDLAREDRLKKYDAFLAELAKIHGSSRVWKIRDKSKDDETGEVCQRALNEMGVLLQKAGYGSIN